ncbi:MAG: hypothetical protein ACYC1E_16990, partial [Propionibacteriaceae bacterium]
DMSRFSALITTVSARPATKSPESPLYSTINAFERPSATTQQRSTDERASTGPSSHVRMAVDLQQGHSRRGVLSGRDASTVDPGNDRRTMRVVVPVGDRRIDLPCGRVVLDVDGGPCQSS